MKKHKKIYIYIYNFRDNIITDQVRALAMIILSWNKTFILQ